MQTHVAAHGRARPGNSRHSSGHPSETTLAKIERGCNFLRLRRRQFVHRRSRLACVGALEERAATAMARGDVAVQCRAGSAWARAVIGAVAASISAKAAATRAIAQSISSRVMVRGGAKRTTLR